MIRSFLTAIFLVVSTFDGAATGQAQPQARQPHQEPKPVELGQLDASQAIFTVMAAINAAGYDAEVDSPSNSPLRDAMRRWVAAKAPSSLAEIRRVFIGRRQPDAVAELSQYISFALCIEGPPGFEWRYRTQDLAPDVAPLDELRPLLAKFYQEADLATAWRQAQPVFEQAIARYHRPVMNALTLVNAYLRGSTSGPINAHFQIYVDLLGAPNQVHTRSYRNDYFVVLTPSPDLQTDSIRHAYLHFMLDPLPVRYADEVQKKRGLIDYAQGAPFLEDYYKNDFLRLAGECLIRAVEARLAPSASRQKMIDDALRQGYVVTPAWADALVHYEKQEQSLRFFFPTLVEAIDLKHEAQRLDKIEFASERPQPKIRLTERPVRPPAGPAGTLEEAEQAYFSEPPDLAKAKAGYERLLSETQEKPLQAKAYYGLARIALRRNDPDTAEKMFGKALEAEPDPQTKAWAQVYLGRLAEASGQPDQAVERYKAALSVEGASDKALQAAREGLEKAGKRNAHP